MSYILDALKKAESERKLGSVPNVYREPLPIAKSEEPVSALRKTWLWIAAAFLAAAGIVFLWMNNASPPAPVSAGNAGAVLAHQIADAVPLPDESAKAGAIKSEASSVIKPAPKEPELKKAELKKPESAPRALKSATAGREKPAETVKPPAKENRQRLAASGAPAEPNVRPEESKNAALAHSEPLAANQPDPTMQVSLLRELPEHIQRSIPQISVGGYIYSAKPAERSMLLNNRLIREGEQLASDLTLEQMTAKEAILSYQGQRFRLPYQTY